MSIKYKRIVYISKRYLKAWNTILYNKEAIEGDRCYLPACAKCKHILIDTYALSNGQGKRMTRFYCIACARRLFPHVNKLIDAHIMAQRRYRNKERAYRMLCAKSLNIRSDTATS